MRVLFTVTPWAGHYRPMVPLGWALQAAGHELRVACHPSEAGPLQRAGLTPVVLTDGWSTVFWGRLFNLVQARQGRWDWPHLPLHPETGIALSSLDDFDAIAFRRDSEAEVIETARRSTDAVVGFARCWRPDVVVHDLVSLEGMLAAAVLGVPDLLHTCGPVGTAEDELQLLPPDFSHAFERYGLPPVSYDRIGYFADPCPPALAPATHAQRLPVRYVPYNGPGTDPAAALEPPARPRVCVVWGNSVTRMFGPSSWLVPTVVTALSTLDVEVIVLLNQSDCAAMGEPPANVRVMQDVPIDLLLDSCDLFVHHGGGNCVLNGARAGVPQLAIPIGLDQHVNGRRLVATGAGAQLRGDQVTVDRLRQTMAALLADGSYRSAAQVLRDQMLAAPSPADLVSSLTRIAVTGPRCAAATSSPNEARETCVP